MSSNTNDLTTNELAVLESLNNAPQVISQRELARRTGLSVGLINAVIKKLVQTGYIKTSQLNHRSLEYLLTPQGFSHATLKSYHYIADVVRRYRSIQLHLREILGRLSRDGFIQFHLHGDGELSELVAVFFAEEGMGELRHSIPAEKDARTVLLNTTPQAVEGCGCFIVDLIKELGNGGEYKK